MTGYFQLPVSFCNVVNTIKFYVVPDVKPPVVFGWDFWRAFDLVPNVLNSLPYSRRDTDSMLVAELSRLHPLETLTLSQRNLADQITKKFDNIAFEKVGLGKTDLITHTIDTGDARPIKQRYYPMSPVKLKELHRELDNMLELGVVEPSRSAWNNPTLMTPKSSGELRFCLLAAAARRD